jgi:hypothetical protein
MAHRIPRANRAEEAPALAVADFHPESMDHRPDTQVRLAYDAESLHVRFDVADRYVLCRHTEHQSAVCKDSCVEFFLSPTNDERYFNVEVNAGGAVLLHYNVPGEHGRYQSTPVEPEWIERLGVEASLTPPVEPEQEGGLTWWVRYAVPFALVEAHAGVGPPASGTQWHANFYKCADASSRPHWASWASIGSVRNFHQPKCFAPLAFE